METSLTPIFTDITVISVTMSERASMSKNLSSLYRKGKCEDGFTLVEILVVMVIMGIISAIAIPVFISQRKNSVDDAIRTDMKNIIQTIDSVRANNPNAGYLAYRNGKVCTGSVDYPSTCPETAPAPVTTSGSNFIVSGGGSRTAGSNGEYFVAGWHPKANKYSSSNTRLYYSSIEKEFKDCPC